MMRRAGTDMIKEEKSRRIKFLGMAAAAAAVVAYGVLKIFIQARPQAGAYAALAAVTLAVGIPMLALCAFLSVYCEWRLERIFPVAALSLGMLMTLALPTYSKPDEIAHFDTAYNLSSHMLGREGCEYWFFMEIRSTDDVYQKTELGKEVYDEYYATFAPVEDETYHFDRINYKTNATLAAFIPAIGVSVARLLHLNFGWVCLFGTLCQLLFYVAAVTYALHKMSVGKQILFVVALLPMTMQQACSFSYDCELLAAAFVVTALAFHWKENGWKRTWACAGECLAYLAGIVLLVTVKSGVYLFLAVLPAVFCLPGAWASADAKKKKTMVLAGVAVLAGLLLAAVIFLRTGGGASLGRLLGQNAYIREFDAYAYSAMHHLRHPGEAFAIFFRTMARYGGYYVLTMVGELLGCLDILISRKVIVLLFAVLLISMISVRGEETALAAGQRIGMLVLGAVPCILAIISMWLYWTPVDLDVIQGIQGRYFLPALPVLMMGAGLWKRPALPWQREEVDRWLGFAAVALNYMTVICIYIAVGMK